MDGVFVTGTDTGVGKTAICAGLLKMFYGSRKVCYWKPIQTNTLQGDDTQEMRELTEVDKDCIVEPVYRFPEPLSPVMAAKKWGKTIELEPLMQIFRRKKSERNFIIVEGAGGILVPLSDKMLQIEFIKAMGLPLIIVGEDRVGTINQTLLTLRGCQEAGASVLGVILTKCRRNLGNAENIAQFGKVEILGEFDSTENKHTTVAQVSCHEGLRRLFGVPVLPQ